MTGLTSYTSQVYLLDRDTGTTYLISQVNGVAGYSSSDQPVISADGTHVAFRSTPYNLTGYVGDYYTRRSSKPTSRISPRPARLR